MCHRLVPEGDFCALLLEIDVDLAEAARGEGCGHCGDRVHRADYPRKPRGIPEGLSFEHGRRLSFCCRKCRRRRTPPSVRFLGRRVYVGAVVVLLSVLRHGVTPRRAARLRALLGVSRRTLLRWRKWWRETFVATAFWRWAQGTFVPPVETERLPRSLWERFTGVGRERLVALLRFLSPTTTQAS